MSNFNDVKNFMETYGQEIKNKSEFPNKKITKLRIDLIKEELDELKEAIKKNDISRSSRCVNRYSVCNLWSRSFFWHRFRPVFC